MFFFEISKKYNYLYKLRKEVIEMTELDNSKLIFRQGNISCYEDHMVFGRYTVPYTDMSELEIVKNGVITHGGIKAYVLSTHQTLSLTANNPQGYSKVVDMINERVRKAQKSKAVAVPKLNVDISALQSFVNSCSLSIESGEERIFKIHGEEFSFSADKDAYNKYRCFYLKMANACGQMFKSEYFSVVKDCDSFLTNYLGLYKKYLDIIIEKTINVLVNAGIWTESIDTVMAKHVEKNYLALFEYSKLHDTLNAILEDKRQQTSALMSLIPNLAGGGFGFAGALQGIAAATAFNLVRDGTEAALINNSKITPMQKQGAYVAIDIRNLLTGVYTDFFNVHMTLIEILNANGHNIWIPSEAEKQQANNILTNVNNPQFPKEQMPKALAQLISIYPYTDGILRPLGNCASQDEVNELKGYFLGMSDVLTID